jgi:hypothetical protein
MVEQTELQLLELYEISVRKIKADGMNKAQTTLYEGEKQKSEYQMIPALGMFAKNQYRQEDDSRISAATFITAALESLPFAVWSYLYAHWYYQAFMKITDQGGTEAGCIIDQDSNTVVDLAPYKYNDYDQVSALLADKPNYVNMRDWFAFHAMLGFIVYLFSAITNSAIILTLGLVPLGEVILACCGRYT